MLYMSHLFSAASGKLSGLVASRNRGGPYVRAHVVPIDPESPEQLLCRTAMSNLATNWRSDLTDEERASWESSATGLRFPNRLGIERPISGRAYFFRQNFIREQCNLTFGTIAPYARNPPLTPSCPFGVVPTATLGSPTDCEIELAWTEEPPWTGSSETVMLVYASEIATLQTNRYFGAWTLIRYMQGDSWASPANFTLYPGVSLGSGERIFYKLIVTQNTGARSVEITGSVTNV